NVADRAPAFNIPGAIGFGNDIFEVRRLVEAAIERARRGDGPSLVELKTFRRRGHGEHDDMGYVPRDLREFWERRDPIRLFTEYLAGEGGWKQADLSSIDDECAAAVDRAVDEAAALPDPRPDTVARRLFAE